MVQDQARITGAEFDAFRGFIYKIAGISLAPSKQELVRGRLAKRLKHHNLDSYGDYFRLLNGTNKTELQIAVDLLTTNETYFFREPKHFEFLRKQILPQYPAGKPFRVWCAASSSGEEPYTIAMELAEHFGAAPWEIVGSDLSTRVLDRARSGQYAMERASHIPRAYLGKYCLKGVGEQDGTFIIEPGLRKRLSFRQVNLNAALPEMGQFEVVFLRNVMIYFDADTKRQVVARILPLLRAGGYLIVSHSESLNGVSEAMNLVLPSIYRKP